MYVPFTAHHSKRTTSLFLNAFSTPFIHKPVYWSKNAAQWPKARYQLWDMLTLKFLLTCFTCCLSVWGFLGETKRKNQQKRITTPFTLVLHLHTLLVLNLITVIVLIPSQPCNIERKSIFVCIEKISFSETIFFTFLKNAKKTSIVF